MGAASTYHWLIVLFAILLMFTPIIPIWRILKRLGLPPALSLLYVVPVAGIIGLWIMAYSRWPIDSETAQATF